MKKTSFIRLIIVMISGITLSMPAAGQNMMTNPGFETSGGWLFTPASVGLSATVVHSGNFSAFMHVTGNDTAILGQCINGLQSGETYEFSYWVKADSVEHYVLPFLRFTTDTGNVFDSYFCPNGNLAEWTRLSARFVPPPGADSVIFYFVMFHKGSMWFDDFSLSRITDTSYHQFTVNTLQTAAPFRDMLNANGAGPGRSNVPGNHVQKFQETGIRYMRTHDYAIAFDYHIIFPDTSKSATDPAAYNFHTTDSCIADIINAGGKVYYRLGESYEMNHEHAFPPANKEKFADVCLQIIRHYNEGWNNGFYYGLDYFEVWNEPDIVEFWSGTVNDYIETYAAVAQKIKLYDASIHVGGPAISNIFNESFTGAFLDSVVAQHLPLDFFSYHLYYYPNPYYFKTVNGYAYEKLQERGLDSVELINSEWNPYLFSFETYSEYGMNDPLNAAGTASALAYMQESTIGKMFRYAFDNYWFGMVDWMDNWRYAGYVFKAWHELSENTLRLECSGQDTLGSTLVASRDSLGSTMYVMVSDNASSAHGYQLSFAGSGSAAWQYTVYRIDENNIAAAVTTGELLPGQSVITQKVHPPYVDYIVLNRTTGNAATQQESGISLYPVPARDRLWVEGKEEGALRITLQDMLGKEVIRKNFPEGKGSLDLSEVPAGLYLATITDSHETHFFRKVLVTK